MNADNSIESQDERVLPSEMANETCGKGGHNRSTLAKKMRFSLLFFLLGSRRCAKDS